MDTLDQPPADEVETSPLPLDGEEAEPAEPAAVTDVPPVAMGGNFVTQLTAEEQKKLAMQCKQDYRDDIDSRKERMQRYAELTRLYSGVLKAKSWPWQRCANVNLSLLTYPVLQIHARLFDMVWPDNGKVIYSQPVDFNDYERARVTEMFANTYIRTKMPEMGPGLDDSLAQLVIYGSAFRRTYWNEAEGRACSDWVPIEDVVVGAKFRSQDPSMRDVPRYSLVLHPTLYEIKADPQYANTENLKPGDGSTDEDGGSEMDAAREKVDGVSRDSDEDDKLDGQRLVFKMSRKWKLPNRPGKNPAFDGKVHAVDVTIDARTDTILCAVVREEDDPDDLPRFEREDAAFQKYVTERSSYDAHVKMVAQHIVMGGAPPVDPQTGAPVLPPVAPTPVDKPKPLRKREWGTITHYRAFPSEGFYGLGLGDFLAGPAKAANTVINQYIDRMTLQNAAPGFISRQLKTQKGAITVEPGILNETDGPIGALKDGIMFLDIPPGDPNTLGIVNMIVSTVEKLSGTGDIMSGNTSGANRTAKEISILSAQVMKGINVLARRVKMAREHELDKLWRLWGTFLPDQPEETYVYGEDGQPIAIKVSRDMFRSDARVVPASDPRMKFEKVEETQNIYTMISTNPLTANNPLIQRAATEEMLRANESERFIPLMGPPPQPQAPPPPPPVLPYWQEEAGWLRNEDPPVHPEDNDDEHILGHQGFMQSQAAMALTKDQRNRADNHLRFHFAQQLEKQGNAMAGVPGPAGPGQGGPPAGMPPGADPNAPPPDQQPPMPPQPPAFAGPPVGEGVPPNV